MIKKISHIGISVRNLGISNELFAKLLGSAPDHTERVEEQPALITFYPVGKSSIELIESMEPAGAGSSIAAFIEKRGEGIHHLCFEVDDIVMEMTRLKNLGFQFVQDRPTPGGDGCLVAFIHPKATNGVLVELSQRTNP